MATGKAIGDMSRTGEHFAPAEEATVWQSLRTALLPLASLKLTVALLGLAMFIVFAGTLAQTSKDIWVVVREYFRTPIAWIDLQVFFPRAFFPDMAPVSGGFYFPGGWLIGLVMAANLLAAHALRFTLQTSGRRLKAGLAVIAAGCIATWLVVAGGSRDGLQGDAFFEWSTLWVIVKFLLLALSLGGAWLVTRLSSAQRVERRLVGALTIVVGALALWLLWEGDDASLGDSSMRILWQLLQGGLAGLILLAGCWLAFQKRAGIVLLHAGIGLMMFSELLVGTLAVETRMSIAEGETVNFVQDLHTSELVVAEPLDREQEQVTAVRQSMLLQGSRLAHPFLPAWSHAALPEGLQRLLGCRYGEKVIRHDYLPFDVEVVRYLQNSAPPRRVKAGDDNPADAGIGTDFVIEERPTGKGTDADGKIDFPAAYVKLLKKGTGEPLGTYLLGVFVSRPERVTVDGKTYDMAMRFKRIYKPYSLHLVDVRADNYLGTETTRNYSSDIRLVDPTRNVDREVHVWMNNPLRFAGETFYQSSYDQDRETGVETTGLQVVSNTGWMIPYVSCMIVAVGMLFQFSVTLLRFLKRRESGVESAEAGDRSAAGPSLARPAKGGRDVPHIPRDTLDQRKDDRDAPSQQSARDEPGRPSAALLAGVFPWVVALLFVGYVGSKARPPRHHDDAFDFYQAGKIPIIYQGRVKPLDTLARNSLKIVSWREDFVDEEGQAQPAVRWLLDLAMKSDEAEKYKVIWIDAPEVLKYFGLTPRKSHLYAGAELRRHFKEFRKEVGEAHDTPKERLTVFQRRLIELDRRLREIQLLQGTFIPPEVGELPSPADLRSNDPEAMRRVAEFREVMVDGPRRLAAVHPPLVVPVKVDPSDPFSQISETKEKFDWQPFSTAWARSRVKMMLAGGDPDPAAAAWSQIVVAYVKDDPQAFNKAVREYQNLLAKDAPPQLRSADVNFESFFNHFAPFYYSAVLYLCVFVLAVLSWLVWAGPLNRAALAATLVALALHSFALVSRIYISGRPPVTNLYTTAVFIGWGCVVLCLFFEFFRRTGVGTVIAGVAGFATLLISHFLSGDGDTFTVLQAVLDTQFWLATHVVIINLGYAATLLAGMFGALFILRGLLTPSLDETAERDMTRMIYGTLCFAIFLSFVGTVLGGLWADDSWGRFWGWDPKENGALLIVLWNALVLHARWGGMVKTRGLAVLAVFGGIVTTWSWFGVNELGVGLHSYGFTAGVLKNLSRFDASQLLIIALGCLPREAWWSYRSRDLAA